MTDEVDGDQETTSTTAPPVTAACTITAVLKQGATGAEVQCLETQLVTGGFATAPADMTFDNATDTAVRAFQTAKALEVDGIVGRHTAQMMGIWAGPLGPMPATDDDCPSTMRCKPDTITLASDWLQVSWINAQLPTTSAWTIARVCKFL